MVLRLPQPMLARAGTIRRSRGWTTRKRSAPLAAAAGRLETQRGDCAEELAAVLLGAADRSLLDADPGHARN